MLLFSSHPWFKKCEQLFIHKLNCDSLYYLANCCRRNCLLYFFYSLVRYFFFSFDNPHFSFLLPCWNLTLLCHTEKELIHFCFQAYFSGLLNLSLEICQKRYFLLNAYVKKKKKKEARSTGLCSLRDENSLPSVDSVM